MAYAVQVSPYNTEKYRRPKWREQVGSDVGFAAQAYAKYDWTQQSHPSATSERESQRSSSYEH